MSKFNNILVVCVGNICRSPVGAGLLKKYFPDRNIESAGLHAVVGYEADKTSALLASQEGVDLSEHRGRQIENSMVSSADLILVMTENQRQALVEKYPAGSGKVMLFGQWLPNGSGETADKGRDITDPIGKSREVFEQVHRLLVDAAESWRTKL